PLASSPASRASRTRTASTPSPTRRRATGPGWRTATSFTYKEEGNGARLDNGYRVLSQIARLAVRWSRPVAGTIKTVTISKAAAGG
ncbi:MAG TPA: hypothetical protein VGS80_10050, partial [Ktedonobacterales bacterium]|nr:hypothetical protein [Ktedonobacterales bacterium]